MRKNSLPLLFLAVFLLRGVPQPFSGQTGGVQVSVSVFSRLQPRSVRVMAVRGGILCTLGSTTILRPLVDIALTSDRQLQCRWPGHGGASATRAHVRAEIPGVPLRLEVPRFQAREFRGAMIVTCRGQSLQLLNVLSLEEYLCGVVGSEMRAPGEALKCQALVSRTYALAGIGRHRDQGFDFCDTTHCQYYRGRSGENEQIRAAVEQTRGLALFFRGKPARVFFHSTCGGMTNSAAVAWGGKSAPYLQPVDDGCACRLSPHFRWQAMVKEAELLRILSRAARQRVSGFHIEKIAPGGWVQSLVLHFSPGSERTVSGEWFHLELGREIGWNTFKSSNFSAKRSGELWFFNGRGMGHGVGLCQYGAAELARQGRDFRQIALFYFPGTEIVKLPNL